MRTVILPASCWAASSRSTTTCSSSASITERSEPPKSAVFWAKLAVPPSSRRSSECSTSVSTSTVAARPTASARPPLPLRWEARSDTAIDDALVDAARVGDHHQQQAGGSQSHHLEAPHARCGQRRVLHDGDLAGELGQQPDGAAQHAVEVDAG